MDMNDLNPLIRHLEDNLDDWLAEELDNYLDDDYLVFDCPGIDHVCTWACMLIPYIYCTVEIN